MKLMSDGLLVRMSKEEGKDVVSKLREKGYKYGSGSAGKGLYSPSWDRQLGEWYGDEFILNPSILHEIGIDLNTLEIEKRGRHRG